MKVLDPTRPFFISTANKRKFQQYIYKIIGKQHNQCFNPSLGEENNLVNKIQVERYISEGSFGRVFIGCFPVKEKSIIGAKCGENSVRIAVKSYKVPVRYMDNKAWPRRTKHEMNAETEGWKEIFIMERMINPMIMKNYTINLPYLYNWYFCGECYPWYGEHYKSDACMILLMELAKSDLYGMWMEQLVLNGKTIVTVNDKEFDKSTLFLLCSLFQVMNGLNAMQQYNQIVHEDIKAQNMLVHRVKENLNEYIHYNVNGIDYWLPNIGTIAMISDFGLCYSTSPVTPIYDKNTTGAPVVNTYKNLGLRPGVIMGPTGKEKLSLFDVKDGTIDPPYFDYRNAGILLEDWKGMSHQVGIVKDKLDIDLRKIYGITPLEISVGKDYKYRKVPLPETPILDRDNKIQDANMILTKEQKQFLKSKNIVTDPKNINFYNHVQQIPPIHLMYDTQDVLRTFAGGNRSSFGHTHMSAPWDIGPLLSQSSNKLLKNVSNYIVPGPESAVQLAHNVVDNLSDVFGITDGFIMSDNPAHMLASYFIRDFADFDLFRTRPDSSKTIIASFTQPNGNGM